METVQDLVKATTNHDDVAVALQVQDAIRSLQDEAEISPNTPLCANVLEKIRTRIYDLNRQPSKQDPFNMLFQALAGKTGNPVEAALQYIEQLMRQQ
ncbi:MAG TPA: hypothetical protein PLK76_02590 [bacterium]|nr:hypothetical protein [bacterium]